MLNNSYLVIGLGNPGINYFLTRHNLGFHLLESLASIHYTELGYVEEYYSNIGQYFLEDIGVKVILLEPLSCMNRSGLFLSKILKRYNLSYDKILVLHDDLDLVLGKIKISNRGDSGHKGVKSIISVLGTDSFLRLRMGIGRSVNLISVNGYVLGKFSRGERVLLNKLISEGLFLINVFLCLGIKEAKSQFNGKRSLS